MHCKGSKRLRRRRAVEDGPLAVRGAMDEVFKMPDRILGSAELMKKRRISTWLLRPAMQSQVVSNTVDSFRIGEWPMSLVGDCPRAVHDAVRDSGGELGCHVAEV